jgi:hypothetical protein
MCARAKAAENMKGEKLLFVRSVDSDVLVKLRYMSVAPFRLSPLCFHDVRRLGVDVAKSCSWSRKLKSVCHRLLSLSKEA